MAVTHTCRELTRWCWNVAPANWLRTAWDTVRLSIALLVFLGISSSMTTKSLHRIFIWFAPINSMSFNMSRRSSGLKSPKPSCWMSICRRRAHPKIKLQKPHDEPSVWRPVEISSSVNSSLCNVGSMHYVITNASNSSPSMFNSSNMYLFCQVATTLHRKPKRCDDDMLLVKVGRAAGRQGVPSSYLTWL